MTQETPPVTSVEMHTELKEVFEPAALARLMRTFEDAVTTELAGLRAAVDGPLDRMVNHGHRLASAASQYGFPELAALAKRIEAMAISGDRNAFAPNALRDLTAAAERALRASHAIRCSPAESVEVSGG